MSNHVSMKGILTHHRQVNRARVRRKTEAEERLARFLQLRERARKDIRAADLERLGWAALYTFLFVLEVLVWLGYLV